MLLRPQKKSIEQLVIESFSAYRGTAALLVILKADKQTNRRRMKYPEDHYLLREIAIRPTYGPHARYLLWKIKDRSEQFQTSSFETFAAIAHDYHERDDAVMEHFDKICFDAAFFLANEDYPLVSRWEEEKPRLH